MPDDEHPSLAQPPPTPPEFPLRREGRVAVGGVILVLVGIFFLISNLFPRGEVGRSFLLLVGVAFLAAYLLGRRNVGFLIPGGIVSGLGLGTLLAQYWPRRESGGIVLLCLGLGFGAIWLFERRHQWSLITGGILAVIGAFILTTEVAEFRDVSRWWPLVLVLLGLWVLFRRAQGAGRGG